jgi:hypothetical protein
MYTKDERDKHSGIGAGQCIAFIRIASPPHSHGLWDPNAMDTVQRADELFNVLHKITYGMEMGGAI